MRSHTLTIITLLILLLNMAAPLQAQRMQDNNRICWTSTINNIYISKKFSVLLEYQWRRENYYKNWQQSLSRTGIQYNFRNDASLLVGYGYIVTYPYGEYPAGPYHIPEHRFFEQLMWDQILGRVVLTHRLRLEQRLIGKINQKAANYDVTGYNYVNRGRFMLRMAVPINNALFQPKTWYAVLFDELLIGFGSNVNQNIFDQNRIGALGGYQFSKALKLEAGIFSQILQQAALVNTKQVYQYNIGPFVSLLYTRK